jgi:hypothetical protein
MKNPVNPLILDILILTIKDVHDVEKTHLKNLKYSQINIYEKSC